MVLLIANINLSYSQDSNRKLYSKFQDLVLLKRDYEKYLYYSINYPSDSITLKKNSIFELYNTQTEEIKKSPDIYLKYIKSELKKKDTSNLKLTVLYKFLNLNDPLVINNRTPYHYIKRNDFLKVIKYSLFDRNDDFLPTEFRGLPVINIDDYNGYNKLRPNEFKDAVKFILNKISCSKEEVAYIKSKQNPEAIVDIKKYLDKNGLNQESEKFIKWAIKILKTDKEGRYSLGILETIYQLNQMIESYEPRDREP